MLYVPLMMIMIAAAPLVFRLWINNAIEIDLGTTIAVAIYVLSQCLAGIYMYLLNGIGAVKRQLIVYCIFAKKYSKENEYTTRNIDRRIQL